MQYWSEKALWNCIVPTFDDVSNFKILFRMVNSQYEIFPIFMVLVTLKTSFNTYSW